MRSSLILSAAISASAALLVTGSQARADDVPANSQPAPAAYAPNPSSVSVMVLPFHKIGDTADGAWISEAIDEDLRSELMRNPLVGVVSAPPKLPTTAADALQAGLWGNAKYVVFGSYQLVDGQVRVTGQVLNVADGSIAASLGATGNLSDLFKMEDALAGQLEQVLPAPPAPTVTAAESADLTTPTTTYYYPSEPATPDYEYPAPAVEYYPSYGYASYGYPYWYGGIGLGFYGGGYYHGYGYGHYGYGFHGGGFPRGGFIGGFHGGGGFIGGFHGGGFGGGFHGGGFGGGHR